MSSKKLTGVKLLSKRRVSTRTTAPTAPRERSYQRSTNRSWPGVPNRNSSSGTGASGRLNRPKSKATVVVRLDARPARLSTSALASVRYSSVLSGVISLTAPTAVVLPAPKPPAITIFSTVGAPACECGETVDGSSGLGIGDGIRPLPLQAGGNRCQQLDRRTGPCAGIGIGLGQGDDEGAGVQEVGDEHFDGGHGPAEATRQLDHRPPALPAQGENLPALLGLCRARPSLPGLEDGFQSEQVPRLGTPARHGVGLHERRLLGRAAVRGHRTSPPVPTRTGISMYGANFWTRRPISKPTV